MAARSWEAGTSGFGYGDGDDRTVLDDMKGRYSTVYARHRFTVGDPASVDSLRLLVKADDGCVAFLNGEEVARIRVPSGSPPAHDALASAWAAEPPVFEEVGIDPGLVRAGENVLAVQGLNQSLSSSDFSLAPVLVARMGGAGARERFDGLLVADPGHRRYLRARLAQHAGRHGEALPILNELVAADPRCPEPVYRLAQSRRARGDPDRALETVEGALRRGVVSAPLWRLWLELAPGQHPVTLLDSGGGAEAIERGGRRRLGAHVCWILSRLDAGGLRINRGGERYIDRHGREWSTDRFFADGQSFYEGAHRFYDGKVLGTQVEEIYRTERWFRGSGEAAYRLLVPPGRYLIRLHFAEITPHSRCFHVSIEGETVLRDYEPLRAIAGVHDFDVVVRDAQLDVEFHHVKDNPKVSALEIERR